MERIIDFYFDLISPFSYFAHHRLPDMVARYGYSLRHHPVDLKTLKLLACNTAPATREIPIKLAYARIDQRRWARHYGIPVNPPQEYASSLLNKGALFESAPDAARRYVTLAFHKVWGEGGPMTTEPLLRSIASAMSWDFGAFNAFIRSSEADEAYARSTQTAHERGVFGVPTMMIGDHLWWGNDRLGFLNEYLEQLQASGPGTVAAAQTR
jgi:2-hydroxychromene-2-carboxylate isomerase